MGQTFSIDNLRRVWDYESRKGINLAQELQKAGEPLDIDLYALKRNYSNAARNRLLLKRLKAGGLPPARIESARKRIEKLKADRGTLVEGFLLRVQALIEDPSFSISFSQRYKQSGSSVFDLDTPRAVNFMAAKAVSAQLRRAFKVDHPSRDEIIAQLTGVLADHYPKAIVKADVSAFYESIDHELLTSNLRKNDYLSSATIRLIVRMLKRYESLTGSASGVPRGIGLSADLSEIFMREVDHHFRHRQSVLFYARFVDDIVMVSDAGSGKTLLDELEAKLSGQKLRLNPSKSSFHEMSAKGSFPPMTFLGYEFEYSAGLAVKLAAKRLSKIKRRLKATFGIYANSRTPSKKAKSMLVQRVQFMTSNTRLANNKRRAYVGIRYSNRYSNDQSQLHDLDAELSGLIAKVGDKDLERKLRRYSFTDGWNRERFIHHTIREFEQIAAGWKHVN